MWTNETVHKYDSFSSSFSSHSYKNQPKSKNMLKWTNRSGNGYDYPSYSSCKCLQAARKVLTNCCSVVTAHTGLVLQPKGKCVCIWWQEILIAYLVATWHRNVFCARHSMKGGGNGFQALSNSRRLYCESIRVDSSVTFSISQVQSYPQTLRTLVLIT